MPPLISRGFRGRRDDAPAGRVPPGQYVTRDFPVLSAGPTPHTPLDRWDFSLVGEVDEPRRWTWEEFRALPSEEVTVDIHCVTKWSKLDTVWQGVSVDTLLDGVETAAEYVVQFCDGGYTTNVPLEDVTGGKAWVASATTASRPGHRPGQHLDVRLTAEDGYQAQRSYSIASPPNGTRIELTVERLDDGEVSPYLTDELRPGDAIELRGPVGGYVVWEPAHGGPLLLVGGGSGVVPLMAMIRARDAAASDAETRLLYSSRGWNDVIYRDELERLSGDGLTIIYALTRSQPPGWTGYARRVDAEMLSEIAPSPAEQPHVYVCGPTPFVEAVAEALVQLGHEPHRVKTERFGPTGG